MIIENNYRQGMGGFLSGFQPILFHFKNLKNFKNISKSIAVPK
jgi:hypothetical protein